jgi:hypothetical protein
MMMEICGINFNNKGIKQRSFQNKFFAALFLCFFVVQFSFSQKFSRGGGDGARGGAVRGPQIRMIWHWRVFRVESLGRRVEQNKSLARDARDDFRRHAAPWPRFADA